MRTSVGLGRVPPRDIGRRRRFRPPRLDRIWRGLRYLRRHGLMALLRRLFPSLRSYRAWVRLYDRLGPRDIAAIRRHIATFPSRPRISLLLPLAVSDLSIIQQAIGAIEAQLYPEWELCIGASPGIADAVSAAVAARPGAGRIRIAQAGPGADLADAANAALRAVSGELVALFRAEDRLAPHALYVLAAEFLSDTDAAIFYSDEDTLGPGGRRHDPRFKTDWDPDLLCGEDMVGRIAAYRRELIVRLGGFRSAFPGAEEHDLALRMGELVPPSRIRHIPMVLYRRFRSPTERTAANQGATAEAHRRAVSEHLARCGVAGVATAMPGNRVRVRRAVPRPKPGVSLIVPTRDRADLLRRCLRGLLEVTDYDPLEIIVVDNGSVEPATRDFFAEIAAAPRVRILNFPGSFNYSAINNFAVAQTRYDLIGLINNDIEVIHRDWLHEMVSHAVRPEIGAVGAKLYYPDDTIQHAGIILGLGGAARNAFRGLHRAEPGYNGRLLMMQSFSAVTAACMILRRSIFGEVGGLDETNLPIAFNDVDLCLRIRDRGYRILWTPFAELYHWESVSRGSDMAPDKIARFRREMAYLAERWTAAIAKDPFCNPNLAIAGRNFCLAFPPRVMLPWRGSVGGGRL